MQDIIPATYFAGHVGPFSAYRTAAYAITIATSRDKLAMPKWRNYLPTQAPDAPEDDAMTALLTAVAQRGRVILLFADYTTFKAWQRKLTEVLA